MARLEYHIDTHAHELELTEPITTIGRAEDCTLQLLHDVELSRQHCSVRHGTGGEFMLVDENATNGTFLNGERVSGSGVILADRDHITVGKTILTFRDHAAGQTTMALREVEEQMEQGKGFSTIMRDIVKRD